MKEVEIVYDELVRAYATKDRGTNIPYMAGLLDEICQHTVDVRISGETVLLLPSPLTNMRGEPCIHPLHFVKIAQTFGERWQDEMRRSWFRRNGGSLMLGQHVSMDTHVEFSMDTHAGLVAINVLLRPRGQEDS
jgi:hypothetical protein